jgi:NADH-quinone oxidoreductase subunit J
MTPVGLAFFTVVALVAVAAAAGVVLAARNAVHSALFLVVTLFCVAVLFLTLAAEFLAAVQILVYAGAIMVLFLFVITLLNPLQPETPDRLGHQGAFAGALALVLLVEIALVIRSGALAAIPGGAPPPLAAGSNVEQLGLSLYSTYLLPFEVTSVLLLVAIVGAVTLARGQR